MNRRVPALLPLAAALVAVALPAGAQTLFQESFDDPGAPTAGGPANLVAAGWSFTVQGGAPGAVWRGGNWVDDPWVPYDLPKHLSIEGLPVQGQPAAAWAVLPDVPGLLSGDQAFFAEQLWGAGNDDRWELRWSPTGGTSTGSAWDDVGDFTVDVPLTTTVCGTQNCWWTLSGAVPGDGGRLALRYVYDTWFGGSLPVASVDGLVITGSPPVPLPQPGETVTWTTGLSPLTILDEKVVPPGGTVVVDPGVTVLFGTASGKLTVEGDLLVNGTAAQPVTFDLVPGAPDAYTRVLVGWTDPFGIGPYTPASADIRQVVSTVPIQAAYGAGLSVKGSTFTLTPGQVRVAGIQGYRATVRVEDTTITGGDLPLNDTYLWVDDLVLDDTPLRAMRFDASSPLHLDGITATNMTGGDPFYGDAPLRLTGSDYWLGPRNVIQGNPLPVSLAGGGLLPGSVVPMTGNTDDFVEIVGGSAAGVISLGRLNVPYVWRYDPSFSNLGGIVNVEPGAVIELEPNASISVDFAARLNAWGTPDAPITFRRRDPNVPWYGITYGVNGTRPKLEHCVVDGAEFGVLASETVVAIESCLFQNNQVGATSNTTGNLVVRKSRLWGNGVGIQTSMGSVIGGSLQGHADLDGFANPNSLVGNGIGFEDLGPTQPETARANWWGDPSGPAHPQNPGGQGDSASGSVAVLPFLSSSPDFTDDPPVVRLEPLYYHVREGDKLILHWSAQDDGEIVAQRLEYAPHDGFPLSVMIPVLPAHVRSVEVVVPAPVPSSNNNPPVFRVVAVDDRGQEGWSESMFKHDGLGTLPFQVVTDLSGGVTVGQQFAFEFTGVTGNVFVFLDDLRTFVDLGWHGYGSGVALLFNDIPAASTDLARYAVYAGGGWYYSDYFDLRPHPLAGDAPPAVGLVSPAAGQSYPAGAVVPVQWTASDDEGLRSFDLQASYDAGFSWHPIVRGLPGSARSYGWRLPASTGIADVRVRVIARDERFQASSDGTDSSFSIAAGGWPPLRSTATFVKK